MCAKDWGIFSYRTISDKLIKPNYHLKKNFKLFSSVWPYKLLFRVKACICSTVSERDDE